MGGIIVLIVVVVLLIIVLGSSIKIIHQQRVGLIERLGKFQRTLGPGPHLVIPIADKVRYNIDMREAVVPFPPQGVITEDNLMVSIDSVIYFQVIDPVRAAYEAQDYIRAIEQLTMTTLRNIIGGLDLEQTLTSREEINGKLRLVLDEATGKWGIKVNRVELRAIEPPPTIRDAMEKGARAERDKRASILIAEGQRQSQILSAGGEKESAILRAQGDREAAVLRAQADRQSQMLRSEGEAQAISTVFNAIHAGQPDQALLSYQYMQMMPQIARGDANKVWVVPSEIGKALEGLGGAFGQGAGGAGKEGSGIPARIEGDFKAPEKIDVQAELLEQKKQDDDEADKRVQEAIAAAQEIEREPGGRRSGSALRSDQKAALGIGPDQPSGQSGQSAGPEQQPAQFSQQSDQQSAGNPFLPQAGPQGQHPPQGPPNGPSSQPTPPSGPPPQQ